MVAAGTIEKYSDVSGAVDDVLKESSRALGAMEIVRLAQQKLQSSGKHFFPTHIDEYPAVLRDAGMFVTVEDAIKELEETPGDGCRLVRPYGIRLDARLYFWPERRGEHIRNWAKQIGAYRMHGAGLGFKFKNI